MDLELNQNIAIYCGNCGFCIDYDKLAEHCNICYLQDAGSIWKYDQQDYDPVFDSNEGALPSASPHNLEIQSDLVEYSSSECGTAPKKKSSDLPRKKVNYKNENDKTECIYCGKIVCRNSLARHMKLCTSDGSRLFRCDDEQHEEACDKSFKTEQQRSHHIKAVHTEPVKCEFPNCDVMLKKKSLYMHRKRVHGDMGDEVNNCKKPKSDEHSSSDSNSCSSNETKLFRCTDAQNEETCDKSFKTEELRSKHIKAVHIKEVKCDFPNCNVILKKKSMYRHRKRVHRDVNNCKKLKFYDYLSSDLHPCTDNEEPKLFRCTDAQNEEACDKSFKTEELRSKHIKCVHSKPIKCDFPNCCIMLKKNNLFRHKKTVHHIF